MSDLSHEETQLAAESDASVRVPTLPMGLMALLSEVRGTSPGVEVQASVRSAVQHELDHEDPVTVDSPRTSQTALMIAAVLAVLGACAFLASP